MSRLSHLLVVHSWLLLLLLVLLVIGSNEQSFVILLKTRNELIIAKTYAAIQAE
jgi:hypothetical protein